MQFSWLKNIKMIIWIMILKSPILQIFEGRENSLSQIWKQWLKIFPRVLVFPLSFSIKMGSKLSLIGDRWSSVIGCLWTWHGGWLSTELSFSLISREMEQKQAIWNKNRPLFLGTYTAARGGFLIFLFSIWKFELFSSDDQVCLII